MTLPGSPPGGGYVQLALGWLRTIAEDHPWMRIKPHAWMRGDLLVTKLPDPASHQGPIQALSGWTLMPDTHARLAYRIATGDEIGVQVLCAVRFVPTKDEPVTTDPDVDTEP